MHIKEARHVPEKRIGSQIPSRSHVLPYEVSEGQKAVDLYESTGQKVFEWQKLILFDMLAKNDDGLYTHTKFGYSIPRRNGKNEAVAIRELYGLSKGERILHTAHRTQTSHSAWERLYNLVEKTDLSIASTYRALGQEHIILENGGRIDFRTRSNKGGLGEGFDLLVIDEAQEYEDDQETALKYVVSSSMNPQTVFCGTPPTPISSGTVFFKLRENILSGNSKNAGWAEWSVEERTDPNDIDAWYKTNPSLGYILTERKIQDEIGNDDVDFNIQRLGWWIRYNQKSAISEKEWNNIALTKLPKLKGGLFVGIKYGKDGTNVAMSIAVKTEDGNILVECIDCQPLRNGNQWILDFLKQARIEQVVIDGSPGQALAEDMKSFGLRKPILPTVKEIIIANSTFEQAVISKKLNHMNQPSLAKVTTNSEHRAIGSNGGFGYRSMIPELDISLLDSCILAFWQCDIQKENKKQKIIC